MEQAYANISPYAYVDTGESGIITTVDIPDPEILEALNSAEKEWYKKFYHGVFFFDGWEKISKSILAQFPPTEKERQKDFLKQLGMKIGTEWSRDNDIRRIDTCMLRSWGKKFQSAAEESPLKLTQVLEDINNDVDRVLRQ